jgi:hypothetical protein
MVKFRVPPAVIPEMTKDMEVISYAEAWKEGSNKPTEIGVWPPELQKLVVVTSRASLHFFRAKAAGRCMCIAVDSKSGEVAGWTCNCKS